MIRELALATALLLTLSLSATIAQEMPGAPATFTGTVTVDGQRVSDGTAVIALIGGKVCGEAEREPGGPKGTWTSTEARPQYSIKSGDSMYVVEVVSDSQVPGCGTEGVMVTFSVGGRPAQQVGVWKAGPNTLNLTAGTLSHVGEPVATPSGGEAPASPASEPEASDDSGFQWWPIVAGGGGLVALAGGAALWQARRTTRRKRA